jgi:hypothetical protein
MDWAAIWLEISPNKSNRHGGEAWGVLGTQILPPTISAEMKSLKVIVQGDSMFISFLLPYLVSAVTQRTKKAQNFANALQYLFFRY